MQFIFRLLEKVAAGTDANKAAKEAYAETLSHYHGFMVKNTFGMGLMAAPSTATMLPCLGSDSVTLFCLLPLLLSSGMTFNCLRLLLCSKCKNG
jgi:hypothetical protein